MPNNAPGGDKKKHVFRRFLLTMTVAHDEHLSVEKTCFFLISAWCVIWHTNAALLWKDCLSGDLFWLLHNPVCTIIALLRTLRRTTDLGGGDWRHNRLVCQRYSPAYWDAHNNLLSGVSLVARPPTSVVLRKVRNEEHMRIGGWGFSGKVWCYWT